MFTPIFNNAPLFIVTVTSAIAYSILLFKIKNGWDSVNEWRIPQDYKADTKVSILIAARNEEKNIKACIDSVLACSYPKELLEIIVINDHSEDATLNIISQYNFPYFKIISLKESIGKKKAIERGVELASGQLIASTDGDCIVPKQWINSAVSLYQAKSPKFIAGPVMYIHNNSLIQRFQYLDAINNMAVTANGIARKTYYMANGANLFYTKNAFQEVGGFDQNAQFASGDDMFLIQEIASKHPEHIMFLRSKEAIVQTLPEKTWNNLINQRTRWSTKSKAYKNKAIIRIQGFVFIFVCLLFISLIIGQKNHGMAFLGFLIALAIKWATDFYYLSRLANFFGDKTPLKSFFGASLAFLIYILYAGFRALFPKAYVWKGRKTQ